MNNIEIKLSENWHTIGALKKALSEIKNDNAKFNVKLCIDSKVDDSNNEARLLRNLCNDIFNLLSDASKCIERCAIEEKQTKQNTIYYDRHHDSNVGARGLLKDVKAVLDSYPEEMMKIDLFSNPV